MADLTATRGGPMAPWQRQLLVNSVAALRERFGTPPADARMLVVHDALLEVLDPPRRAARLQKEYALAAQKAARTIATERRNRGERRQGADRRTREDGPPDGVERRVNVERRAGRSRRRMVP